MGRQDKRVTLKDIAKEAGVSVMAVSKVLNGKGGISRETSQRVQAIARTLRYRPNQIAKSLRADETKTLGVVVSDSSQLVFAKVIRGIEDTAARAGYSVIVANTDQNAEREKKAVELLLDKRIDGLILAAPLRTDGGEIQDLLLMGPPLVLLMRTSETAEVSCVINDNYAGGYEILSHLLATGSRDIRFLSLPGTSQSGQSRRQGYRKALAEYGLAFDEIRVLECPPAIEAGYQAMNQLLDRGLTGGAICCGCDLIAIGAIRAIQEHQFRIPADFQVTGYDDIDLADYLSVPLTTMRQPKYEIGCEGVRLLLEQIKDPSLPPRQIILPSSFIKRQST